METENKKLPLTYDQLFIGGSWVNSLSDDKYELKSPHDQSLVGSVVLAAKADIDAAVNAAQKALRSGPWSKMLPVERQEIIECFNGIHHQYVHEFAGLITKENGSPIWFTSMLQDLMKLQNETCLRSAKAVDWELRQPTYSGERLIRREPVGVVAVVITWNVPQQSALIKIVPALLAGCTVVLKPTPATALDGLALGELFRAAGLPDGVLNIVPADREVGEYLISHAKVDKVTFTGSTAAGKKIASIAGSQMKRFSMELGGKAAAIILENADIPSAIENMKFGAFVNSGESCFAKTRVLAPRKKYDQIVSGLKEMISGLTVGNPALPENFIGPMVNEAQFEKVRNYVQLGIREGARLVTGGIEKPAGDDLEKGWYIKPTLFADVNNQMRIAREEIFGPVLMVIPYDTVEEAIEIANDSDYGLCAAVFGSNIEEAVEVSRQILAGSISINGAFLDFDSPFGGYKQSGVGRESGIYGIEGFTELKAVFI
ncbi:MAG: aldehyde dehydrogenase [Bacteroidota bacterium]|nr:aldehyde dehydrogenase [Bacteroidota bacterium]